MIVDTMTKQEVVESLIREYNRDVYPLTVKSVLRNTSLIREQSKREKKTVYLDWENVDSKNMVKYRFRIWGSGNNYQIMTVAQFVWRGRKCFARIEHGYKRGDETRHVWVYQQHALERYAERVLKMEDISPENVYHKYLSKTSTGGMVIALPSRTHERTVYIGHSDALFFGEDMAIDDLDNMRVWVNTCISYDQAGYTQSKMLSSFKELISTIRLLGFDPATNEAEYRCMDKHKKMRYEPELIRFFKLCYMFGLLQMDLGVANNEQDKKKLEERMAYLEECLEDLGVDCSQLNPYYENTGIASEYDLNYIPYTEKAYEIR